MERAQGSDPAAAPSRPRHGVARLDSTLSQAHLRVIACAFLGTAGLLSGACTGHRKPAIPSGAGEVIQRGQASWYGAKFNGRRTASGERYDMRELTAAHPSLPFGTLIQVTNVENGRQVVVRINDRGPFSRRRIIDVSYAAARELDLVGPGTARVELALVREEPRPEPVQRLLPAFVVAEAPDSTGAGAPATAASGLAASATGSRGSTTGAEPGAPAGAGTLTFLPLSTPAEGDPSTSGAENVADPGPPPEPVHSRAVAIAAPLNPRPTSAGAAGAAGSASAAGGLTPRTARPVGSVRYTVQVGAFSEPERAEALQQQLAARYPQAAVRSDGIWNRVQVGLFTNRDDAEALREDLAGAGLEAVVITAP